jgi:pimeloyl-ACP methyl ester carboxylesterase
LSSKVSAELFMINHRKYGSPPFKIAVIHGGPGAPGYMAPVARELSKNFGILEPLQTMDSIERQVEELYDILNEHVQQPVTLIGHSWGGFLSIIFASKYPQLIYKLILLSSGPFEDKYVAQIKETRMQRLTVKERETIQSLENELKSQTGRNSKKLLERLGSLSSRADSYEPLPSKSEVIEYQPDVHIQVWNEAKEMRKDGKFIEMIRKICCPVIAIHGDYDPHPFEGVKEPFSKYIKDFRFILLEKCGHYPWLEKYAKDKFYEVLQKLLQENNH